MKRVVHALTLTGALVFFLASTAFAAEITGAGSTFAYPIYAKWAQAYKKETGVGLNYQSIGSGGGIRQIEANTVNFGASDEPLKVATLQKNGLVQFPTAMGGVVPVVHLEGIKAGQLKLTGPVLADIYLGKITKWNSPLIAKLNKGLKLPDQYITVVHRSDGSGTTFIFTNYLCKISPRWKEQVGNDTAVSWPAGVGGKGNEGVASYVQRINGSIGYVEYAYALQNHMTYVVLRNRDGRFVKPTAKNFQAAASGADWAHAPEFYQILTNEPGPHSWPITGATFILMHKRQAHPQTAKQVLDFFKWAYQNGDQMALQLDYIPMPKQVVKLIFAEWHKITGPNGHPLY